jgi:hypothetical protein
MGGRENIAPHTMKVSELSAESKRCDSGDVTHLQHSELVSGGRKGESCSKRSGRCSLQDASRGHREIREATPKEDAIGVWRNDVPLYQGANGREVQVRTSPQHHPGDQRGGPSRPLDGVADVSGPCESLSEVNTEVFILRREGDGEPTQGEGFIRGGEGGQTSCEDDELCLGSTKTHAAVLTPLIQVGYGGRQLSQVLGLEGGGGCELSGRVRSNGPIIREEGGADETAVGVAGDRLLKAVDEDEEEEGAEYTPLRDTVMDGKPGRVLGRIDTPHTTMWEEGTNPQPGLAGDTSVMHTLEEDGVIHSVERLLNVQEEDRTLKGIRLSAEF